MGFGVSGATGVILLAALVATSIAFGALSVAHETISEAGDAETERLLDQHNTDIEFVDAVNDTENRTLSVGVRNTGSIHLTLSGTDVLVDNRPMNVTMTLYSATGTALASGDSASLTTDAWLPGETVWFSVSDVDGPRRVTVVAPRGVRISASVSDLEAM